MKSQKLKLFRKTLSEEENLLLEFQIKTLNYLKPYLSNQFKLEKELGKLIKVKDEGNRAFDYDLVVNDLLFETLKEYNYQGQVYSEETKWSKLGNSQETIVSDPICNSSLIRRGFRNVASSATYFDKNKNFVAGVITYFGTQIICLADKERVLRLLLLEDSVLIQPAQVSKKTDLDFAFIVFSAYDSERRVKTLEKSNVLKTLPLILDVVGGQPAWSWFTQGSIDAYVNPFKGTKIYEAAAGEIAKRAGGIFRDMRGKEINVGDYLDKLHEKTLYRLPFIATCTEELYQKIMALI